MEDETAIRELIATWHRATAAGDIEAILPLMSDDVVFLIPGQPPMKGREQFATSLREVLKEHEIDSESGSQIIELDASGSLAYAWMDLTVTIRPRKGGERVVRRGFTLTIFRKGPDGSWLLYRDANMVGGGTSFRA